MKWIQDFHKIHHFPLNARFFRCLHRHTLYKRQSIEENRKADPDWLRVWQLAIASGDEKIIDFNASHSFLTMETMTSGFLCDISSLTQKNFVISIHIIMNNSYSLGV